MSMYAQILKETNEVVLIGGEELDCLYIIMSLSIVLSLKKKIMFV